MATESTLKAAEELKKKEEKKSKVPENGAQRNLEAATEPVAVAVQLHLLLDKVILRECKNDQDVICYLLDILLKSSNQFVGLAAALRKDALGKPELYIPNRRIERLH